MKTIKQEVYINAKPQEVYDAYMDAKKHAEFTGANVKFENKRAYFPRQVSKNKVGGKFDIWDGSLTGENVELVLGKKIVQKWRADDWPKGHFSNLTLEFFPDGERTKLVLVQTGVPDDKADDIDAGWHDYYWKPMNEYFKK